MRTKFTTIRFLPSFAISNKKCGNRSYRTENRQPRLLRHNSTQSEQIRDQRFYQTSADWVYKIVSHPYYNSNSHDYSYKELLTSDEIILVALFLPKGIFIVIRFELYILLYMSHVLTSNALVRTSTRKHVRETLRPNLSVFRKCDHS